MTKGCGSGYAIKGVGGEGCRTWGGRRDALPLRNVQERYATSRGIRLEVLDAQVTLTRVRFNVVAALADYQSAHPIWLKAVGERATIMASRGAAHQIFIERGGMAMRHGTATAIVAGVVFSLSAAAWAQQGGPSQPPTGSTEHGGAIGHGQSSPGMGPGMMMGGQGQHGGMGMGHGMMMGPGGGMGPGMMGPGMMMGTSPYERPLISQILSAKDQLGLSADQEQKLRRLRSEFEKESIRRGAEVQAAEVDLRDLLAADAPDLGKIESQVRKIGALQADLRFARIKVLQEGRGILTIDQWQKFEALGVRPRPMGPGRGQRPGGQPG